MVNCFGCGVASHMIQALNKALSITIKACKIEVVNLTSIRLIKNNFVIMTIKLVK